MKKLILRRFWARYFNFDWKLGLLLICIFVVLRFIIALNNARYGGSSAIFLLFLSMWFVPIIFLTSEGRKAIGIRKPDKWIKLFYSFLAGGLFCAVTYLITYLLYGYSIHNSFVYMSRVYGFTLEMLEGFRYQFFFISLCMSMTFSPIGEEILYRGVIHGCFVGKYGENKASVIDSLVFMIVHLPHFEIIYDSGKWSFPFFPALLWMVSMFLVSRLFFRCKMYSHSIWGAVLAHSGYNGVMMYFTYFHIL
ncbi:MAG: CPBP family intramembrane metalloprotease [Candidatus Azobacteroides sp.]|nr:CPBP family intramembrane metalloprotease [Candidatus Azobacteroides sp.]